MDARFILDEIGDALDCNLQEICFETYITFKGKTCKDDIGGTYLKPVVVDGEMSFRLEEILSEQFELTRIRG